MCVETAVHVIQDGGTAVVQRLVLEVVGVIRNTRCVTLQQQLLPAAGHYCTFAIPPCCSANYSSTTADGGAFGVLGRPADRNKHDNNLPTTAVVLLAAAEGFSRDQRQSPTHHSQGSRTLRRSSSEPSLAPHRPKLVLVLLLTTLLLPPQLMYFGEGVDETRRLSQCT